MTQVTGYTRLSNIERLGEICDFVEHHYKEEITLQDAADELGLNREYFCRFFAKNMGISFLPDYVTEEAVRDKKLFRLKVEDFEVELWKQIIYHRDKWISLQMQAVIEHISQINLK